MKRYDPGGRSPDEVAAALERLMSGHADGEVIVPCDVLRVLLDDRARAIREVGSFAKHAADCSAETARIVAERDAETRWPIDLPIVAARDHSGVWHVLGGPKWASSGVIQCTGARVPLEAFATCRSAVDLNQYEYPHRVKRCVKCWGS